jgi:hypothetical protein
MNIKAIAWLVSVVLTALIAYHQGSLAPKLAAAKAGEKQQAGELAKDTKDAGIVNQEAKTYEHAQTDLDPIPLPDVRVCYYKPAPTPVPRGNPPATLAHGATAIRAEPRADLEPGPNISPAIAGEGHKADAQVAGLQDYINRVCLAGAPRPSS